MAKPTRYTTQMVEDFFKKKEWLPTALFQVWERNAASHPDREAVVDEKNRYTWKQAAAAINRFALALAEAGFKKDDILVLQLPNVAELPLLRVACEKGGVMCLPVLRNLRTREVEYILGHLKVRGIVIPVKYRGFDYFEMANQIRSGLPELKHIWVLDDAVPAGATSVREILNTPLENKYPADHLKDRSYRPEEVSLINHTTGTTGFPKFVEYPMAARLRLGRGFIESLKLTDKDVVCALGAVPAGANCVPYFGAPQAGAKVVMLEHFEAEAALKLISKEGVTVACGVPAMWSMLVERPNARTSTGSVRLWWNAGAFLPPQLGAEVEAKLGGVILSGLGASDFGGTMIPEIDAPQEVRLLTVGKGRAGTSFKVVDDSGREVKKGDVGEIWGAGPSAASGYFGDSETTWQCWTKDGWFKTGDLGKVDEQGNLILVGRKKDLIIRGGQNIYPAEIETLLLTHPAVASVAVVAMPDQLMGEKACAYVELKPGQSLTFKEMGKFLTDQDIALYKIPERLEIIENMPMVAGTKIDKKVLQKDIADKLNPSPSMGEVRRG
ncbi:MAG: AMP-binding protein [Chloroflexi bacterium]|nr:AMP-binding protein [Chloroflexota bacterium]